MICLSKTWLDETDELFDLQMDNYLLHVNSAGRGKEEDLQVSKFTSIDLDIISMYRFLAHPLH